MNTLLREFIFGRKRTTSSRTPRYGLLYNNYAVNDSRTIAPIGWHVPTSAEYDTLIATVLALYPTETAPDILKEVGEVNWLTGNTGKDLVGFKLLGAGSRYGALTGAFDEKAVNAELGSTSIYEYDGTDYWSAYNMYYLSDAEHIYWTDVGLDAPPLWTGTSIRCVRDSAAGWTPNEVVLDYDENLYHTTKIGTQVWLVENLAVTHYNNGDTIPEITDNVEWIAQTVGALCAYENNWADVFTS